MENINNGDRRKKYYKNPTRKKNRRKLKIWCGENGRENYRKREEEETYFSTLTEIIEENWKIESASQEK